MNNITKELFNLRDEKYAVFQAKLTPNIPFEKFIGVRVPVLRTYAKTIKDSKEALDFINTVPHDYYDEYMLQGLLISEIKDYDTCIKYLDKFLPYVNNWAVCDICSPKIFKKNKDKLINKIKEWVASDLEYTIRFGLEMLMSFYLDDDFKEEYLELPLKVNKEEYYVKMMQAWFFATALSKQWDSTIKIIESKELSTWVQNKSIQKAIESYRITPEQKEYLRTLKK